MESIWIVNARIAAESGWIENGAVRVERGRIVEMLSEGSAAAGAGAKRLDAEGMMLIPGMIDVHIHGANGYDIMDGTTESIQEVSKACVATGCTSFLATSVSSSLPDLLAMIDNVKKTAGSEEGASIVGIHLEGPYLNVKRKGMQNEAFLRHPDLAEMATIFERAGSLLKMVTVAPELPGGMELVAFLSERDIVAANAHSDASYEEAKEAFRRGASHITHCFNGMRPIHHRDPGIVVAALEERQVSVQAIVDNVHLHPAIVCLLHRAKGAEGVVLITDALQAMGLGDGEYVFGGHNVQVRDGIARLSDGTLASSTVTMNDALRNTARLGVPLLDAIAMASRTPADVLGLPHKGRIAPGAAADLVLLDDRYEVQWTVVGGRSVFRRR